MTPAGIRERDLESLDSIWSGGLGAAWEAYRDHHGDGRVTLAAALVETGVSLQGLGLHTAPAADWRSLRKPLCALLVLRKPPAEAA